MLSEATPSRSGHSRKRGRTKEWTALLIITAAATLIGGYLLEFVKPDVSTPPKPKVLIYLPDANENSSKQIQELMPGFSIQVIGEVEVHLLSRDDLPLETPPRQPETMAQLAKHYGAERLVVALPSVQISRSNSTAHARLDLTLFDPSTKAISEQAIHKTAAGENGAQDALTLAIASMADLINAAE